MSKTDGWGFGDLSNNSSRCVLQVDGWMAIRGDAVTVGRLIRSVDEGSTPIAVLHSDHEVGPRH